MAVSLAAAAENGTALNPAEEHALAIFGALPAFEHVALSPDGSRLAYVGTVGDEQHVLVKNFSDGRKLVDFTGAPGQKMRSLQWADNDRILASVSITTAVANFIDPWDEYFGVIAADVNTGKAWDVLEYPGGTANNVGRLSWVGGRLRSREIDGETWVYVSGYFASGALLEARGKMMKISLATRTHRLIESRDLYAQYDGLLDARGNAVAIGEFKEQQDQRWQILVGTDGHLRQALSGEAQIDLPTLRGISPDGQELWLVTWNNGVASPSSVTLADGKPVASDSLRSGSHPAAWHSVLLDRRNDRVVAGVIEGTMGPSYEFIDPKLDLQWQNILHSPGVPRPTIVSHSDDFGTIVVLVQVPTGPEYWMIDMATAHFVRLGPVYRQLPPIASVQDIEYPAADRLIIPAYLTLPAGRTGKGLPLVVMPHGGPAARDRGGFDWWAQALAHEGYAVLQPNFRGSTVSNAHLAAGEGQWGRKMQTDLSDGVSYLAALGIIDPSRVCIVGASYGGYAALAGISLQHGIYRCAVSVAGVSDLRGQMKRAGSLRGLRYYERWLGVSDDSDTSIDERSPLKHADAINVPLLLIHGRDDTVVLYDQSSRMADALRHLNRPLQMVDLKSEDHWLSHGQTRLQMLEATVVFLKANNPPDASEAPSGLH